MRIVTRRLRMRKRCVFSGKPKYASKLDCLIDNADPPGRGFAYRCLRCRFWHPTRRPQS